jgi:hypothetical protein
MSRTIAMKAFAAGDKVCPYYLRTLASNVHKSGGISTVERHPGPVAAAVTCWIERANEANGKSPPGLFRRALIVLLAARDRSARIIETEVANLRAYQSHAVKF